jgi:probable HAF family extracellular repeat protein
MKHGLPWAAMLLLLCGFEPASGAPLYTIQHIAGLQDNYGVHLSDSGDVVAGRYLWTSGGGRIDLGGLGGNFTAAEGVNATGQVVGRSALSTYEIQGFLWQNGTIRALPALDGQESFATGINNRGEAVGYSDNVSAPSVEDHRATFWTTAQIAIDIGALPGLGGSRASAINDLGHAAGVSFPNSGAGFGYAAFFWDGSILKPISQIQDVTPDQVNVSDVNDADRVVGRFNSRAFWWQAGSLVTLGTLGGAFSEANAINDAGQIVGRSTDASGAAAAFLYQEGQMVDLNELVVGLSGWERLEIAYDINESGQIVGIGKLKGGISDSEVFLLTPIPEPAVTGLFIVGTVVFYYCRGRRSCSFRKLL